MIWEDKELLLKDLCARLPYKVKVQDIYYNSLEPAPVWLIDINTQNVRMFADEGYQSIEYIRPYLFPLSSMTEEQMEELKELCNMYTPDDDYHPYAYKGIKVLYKHVLDDNYKFNFKIDVIDWFNKNKFDYRGLIEKGLALDATGLNIY